VLTPFDEVDRPPDALIVDPSVPANDLSPVEPLQRSSAAGIAWASLATLALLSAAGYGWARIGLGDAITAALAAPAIGASLVILVAVALDALGARLGTTPAAVSASVLAGGGGYLARFVLERRAGSRASPQIDEQPAE